MTLAFDSSENTGLENIPDMNTPLRDAQDNTTSGIHNRFSSKSEYLALIGEAWQPICTELFEKGIGTIDNDIGFKGSEAEGSLCIDLDALSPENTVCVYRYCKDNPKARISNIDSGYSSQEFPEIEMSFSSDLNALGNLRFNYIGGPTSTIQDLTNEFSPLISQLRPQRYFSLTPLENAFPDPRTYREDYGTSDFQDNLGHCWSNENEYRLQLKGPRIIVGNQSNLQKEEVENIRSVVELALQGNVSGHEKRIVAPQMRDHTETELNQVSGLIFSNDFLNEHLENVEILGAKYQIPELELVFLERLLNKEENPRYEGFDFHLLGMMYKLDLQKIDSYLDSLYIQPRMEYLRQNEEAIITQTARNVESYVRNNSVESLNELIGKSNWEDRDEYIREVEGFMPKFLYQFEEGDFSGGLISQQGIESISKGLRYLYIRHKEYYYSSRLKKQVKRIVQMCDRFVEDNSI